MYIYRTHRLIMSDFKGKSVKELQEYLKERGVVFSGLRKASLEELCISANQVGLDVDPDGLKENRDDVIQEKLILPDGSKLELPTNMDGMSTNIAVIKDAVFNIFDIFSYLTTKIGSSGNKDIRQMEGNSLAKDGYVIELKFAQYGPPHQSYYAVLGKVKPREREKDPVSGLKYYWAWVIISCVDDHRIVNGLCWCKGG